MIVNPHAVCRASISQKVCPSDNPGRGETMVKEKEKETAETWDEHNIWEKPNIKAMLQEPIDAPVHLTREEAIAIIKASFGSRPDFPPGKEYVRKVRPLLGQSVARRMKKYRG